MNGIKASFRTFKYSPVLILRPASTKWGGITLPSLATAAKTISEAEFLLCITGGTPARSKAITRVFWRFATSSTTNFFSSTKTLLKALELMLLRLTCAFVPVLTSAGLGLSSTSFSAQQGMFWFSFDHCGDCVDFSESYPRHQKQKQLDKQSISHSQCS